MLLPSLIALGFWQLSRAEEKEQLLNQESEKRNFAPQKYRNVVPVELSEKDDRDVEYRQVTAYGHYLDNKNWWLENRIKFGRPGFHVLSLFQLDDGTEILVNRGWVAAEGHRTMLPALATPREKFTISGILVKPKKHALLSYFPEIINGEKIIATVDIQRMAVEINSQLEPYVIFAEQYQDSNLIKDWPTYSTKPEKHKGYAVQWFVMAFVLLIFCLYANTNIASWITYKRKGRAL